VQSILLLKYELASKELAEKAHRHNLMVFPWTLNTEQEIRWVVDIGVDGFATDDPCFARQSLRFFP
jgi:glycerophosphoryl diester phosphodiesterase